MQAEAKSQGGGLSDLVAEKFSVAQIFIALNVALILGVGGTLYLMRQIVDAYIAIPQDFIHLAIIAIPWVIVALTFVLFMVRLHANKQMGAGLTIILILAIAEILFFGLTTQRTFAFIPRSHQLEDHQKIDSVIAEMNKSAPITINEFLTLKSATFVKNFIVFNYAMKEQEGLELSSESVRGNLLQGTCHYFTDYPDNKILASITNNFASDKNKFMVMIRRQDCMPSKPESQPTKAVQPTPPSEQPPATNGVAP